MSGRAFRSRPQASRFADSESGQATRPKRVEGKVWAAGATVKERSARRSSILCLGRRLERTGVASAGYPAQ